MSFCSSRITLPMNDGWRFHKGDIFPTPPDPRCVGAYYCMVKSYRARGAALPSFNDADWQKVSLPHDCVISSKVDPKYPSAHASLPRENSWYRMHFSLPEETRGRRAAIEFDGIATKCEVWVNGHLVKRHLGAYIGFEADFTDVAVYGGEINTVAVHVDLSEFEGWWYEGGGIYRPARLTLKNPRHVSRWGVWANPKHGADVSWTVQVETELNSIAYETGLVTVQSVIVSPSGEAVAKETTECVVNARNSAVLHQSIAVSSPMLWSPEDPSLYRLETRLFENGVETDACDTNFGFRTVEFSDEGMRVNGKTTKIRGTCVHEDYGSLGVAVLDPLRRYRLETLRKMGVNGIRCAHNPQSEQQLDLCDQMGMMVMDETRWFESYGEGLEQLRDMIRRDRNHPCVFFWSMGNEESCQSLPSGGRIMRAMREAVRQMDDTRPCLLAMHTGLLDDGAVLYNDVIGMNYNEAKFDQIHKRFLGKALIGSEMYSTSLDPEGNRSLGLYACEMLSKLPFLTGIYMWTGIDYRGEHIYPTVISNAGAIDLNCRPRDDFYLYRAMWTNEPTVFIHTHWNHKPGETVEVYVYSNMDSVELLCNGKSLGIQRVIPYCVLTWQTPFEAGELRAVGTKGEETVEHAVRTSGEAVSLKMWSVLPKDDGLTVVNIQAIDDKGYVCMNCSDIFGFRVEGGTLIGACNGDIRDYTQPFKTVRPLYEGFCQLVIRPESNSVRISAYLLGKPENTLSVTASPFSEYAMVKSLPSPYVTGWLQSGVFEEKPDVRVLEAEKWNAPESDLGVSWNFYELRPIDNLLSDVKAWVVYYAKTIVPDSARSIRFGNYNEGTMIYISRSGHPRDEFIIRVDGTTPPVFDASELSAGERLEVWIVYYAKYTYDGLNDPVYWL